MTLFKAMEDNFTKRLNRVLTEIKNFKMNQTIGGDSWLVYRAEVSAITNRSREYVIRFSPETNNDFVAVCKITSPDRIIPGSIADLIPDPNVNGKWWRPFQGTGGLGVEQTFFVYSTVKGTVSIEDVTGQDAGNTS